MKKTTLILALVASVAAANAQNIGVTVNGKALEFDGAEPVMRNNSVLVPMRAIFEELGADLKWNQARQEVTANKEGKHIRLVIGQRFADVDGKSVELATPAVNQNGSTLVPLRFVSEAMGAQVRWNPNRMMVMVRTDGESGRAQPIRGDRDRNGNGIIDPEERRNGNGGNEGNGGVRNDAPVRDAIATMYKSTVIPVRLDTDLSSNESRAGDKFTASLDSTNGIYGQLPGGTKVEGRVITAKRQAGNEPGMLELSFDRLILPNGQTQELSGSLIDLKDKGVKADADGRLVATGASKDNRGVYAGYGAGAGLIVGLLGGNTTTKGNVTKALLGGLLGLGAGELERQKSRAPSNVRLSEGAKFGVRLDEDLTIYRTR